MDLMSKIRMIFMMLRIRMTDQVELNEIKAKYQISIYGDY